MKQEHDSKYYHWALAVFLVLAACAVFCAILFNLRTIAGAVGTVLSTIASVFYGLVIAYLLNPIAKKVENFLLPRAEKKFPKSARTFCRVLGIAAALLLLVLIIVVLLLLLIPQLLESIELLISNMAGYISTIEGWVSTLLENYPELISSFNDIVDRAYAWLQDFLQNDLPGILQTAAVNVTSSLISFIMVIVNLVIGLVISIYVLFSRERFLAQAKKITVAFFRPAAADWLMSVTARADHIFGGFIRGKLLDSFIIGVLCFIGMCILGLPYPVLVAVIIGVTNIIPFFGPWIGAIPTTLLILVVDPLQGLYFLIFILVLQQLDGNIIGPRILGDATGLSGFWVVVALTLFGGLFGFAGMILGVPLFALLYSLFSDLVNHFLRKKGHTTETGAYYAIRTVADLDASAAEAVPDATETPAAEAGPSDKSTE